MQPSFIRINELASKPNKPGKLPVSAATIWRWVRDCKFPTPIRLGPGITAWPSLEIEGWIKARNDEGDAIAATPSASAPARHNPVPISTDPTRRKPGRPRKLVAQGVPA